MELIHSGDVKTSEIDFHDGRTTTV